MRKSICENTLILSHILLLYTPPVHSLRGWLRSELIEIIRNLKEEKRGKRKSEGRKKGKREKVRVGFGARPWIMGTINERRLIYTAREKE